jgi:predicted nuclease with RNAse H fold
MDVVARRDQGIEVSGPQRSLLRHHQRPGLAGEDLLVLGTAVKADQAPRKVIVHRRLRGGGNDEAEQRKRAVAGAVEQPLPDTTPHPALRRGLLERAWKPLRICEQLREPGPDPLDRLGCATGVSDRCQYRIDERTDHRSVEHILVPVQGAIVSPVARWLGIDVGGKRKGFDLALIDDRGVISLVGGLGRSAVLQRIEIDRPAIVGIDSPRCCAPDGRTVREDERRLARSICGIRWTPDEKAVRSNAYYAWIVEGLSLFGALAGRGVEVIEVFPTASWTRWHGPRAGRSRSAWTRAGLATMGLAGVPARTNQDQRDAIAAAVTARQHDLGETEAIGEIVVPAGANR